MEVNQRNVSCIFSNREKSDILDNKSLGIHNINKISDKVYQIFKKNQNEAISIKRLVFIIEQIMKKFDVKQYDEQKITGLLYKFDKNYDDALTVQEFKMMLKTLLVSKVYYQVHEQSELRKMTAAERKQIKLDKKEMIEKNTPDLIEQKEIKIEKTKEEFQVMQKEASSQKRRSEEFQENQLQLDQDLQKIFDEAQQEREREEERKRELMERARKERKRKRELDEKNGVLRKSAYKLKRIVSKKKFDSTNSQNYFEEEMKQQLRQYQKLKFDYLKRKSMVRQEKSEEDEDQEDQQQKQQQQQEEESAINFNTCPGVEQQKRQMMLERQKKFQQQHKYQALQKFEQQQLMEQNRFMSSSGFMKSTFNSHLRKTYRNQQEINGCINDTAATTTTEQNQRERELSSDMQYHMMKSSGGKQQQQRKSFIIKTTGNNNLPKKRLSQQDNRPQPIYV